MENKTNKKDLSLWMECLTVLTLAATLTFVNCDIALKEERQAEEKRRTEAAALASIALAAIQAGPAYAIGGTVTGLTTSGLVLQNNGADDLTVTTGAVSFNFPTKIKGTYSVTFKTQPSNSSCTVSRGSGTASADVTNVSIICATTVTGTGTGTGTGGFNAGPALNLTGAISVLAGPPAGTTTSGDVEGTGTAARFWLPNGIASDGTNLYVTDGFNNKIKKIVIATGAVSILAGPPAGTTTTGDVEGIGTAARFSGASGIATDGTNLYVADSFNQKIKKIVIATGAVNILAGPPAGTTTTGDVEGIGTAARFNNPNGIASDGTNLYVVDKNNNKIKKIVIATGAVSILAGPPAGTTTTGDVEGIGTAARFLYPVGIAIDGTNLYVTDGDSKIKKIVIATGAVSIFAGAPVGTYTTGDVEDIGTAARFNSPTGIASDGTNLYVVDKNNNKIKKIVIATGAVNILAGPVAGTTTTGDVDGTGYAARFNIPNGIAKDGSGLYIVDSGNNKIRKIQ